GLEQHGQKEGERQHRNRQLDARSAAIGPSPILAHLPLPAGAGIPFAGAGADPGAGKPCLVIKAMSWASRLPAALTERLCTRTSPMRCNSTRLAINCWRWATSSWNFWLKPLKTAFTSTRTSPSAAKPAAAQRNNPLCRTIMTLGSRDPFPARTLLEPARGDKHPEIGF